MSLTVLWPKLFADLFLLLLFVSVYRLEKLRSLRLLAGVVVVLLLRDFLYSYFGIENIIPLSELLVLLFYLMWLRSYTGRRSSDLVYLLLNAAAFAAGISTAIWEWLPQSPFYLSIVLLADMFYLSIALGIVSPFNTENCEIILRTRFVLIAGFFMAYLIGLLYGYRDPMIHRLLLPSTALIHGFVLVRYNGLLQEQTRQSVAFYSTNLDATYGFMENLGKAITAKIDLPNVLQIIISSAAQNTGADAGAILMVDEYENVLNVQATHGIYPPLSPVAEIVRIKPSSLKRHFAETSIPIGETPLGEAVREGRPIFIRDARQDERLRWNLEDDIMFISSLIAIPLVVGNRVLGVLSILKRAQNRFFEERDFEHLNTFAEFASITIDNIYTYLEVLEKREIERELDIAAEIQQKLLPTRVPEIPRASIGVYTRPARGVSGDYYDIIRLDKRKVALVICDVAGKGIPAALVMIMIRSILHLVVSPQRDAATTLSWINRGITGRIDIDHFATIGFVVYDHENKEILYSNAAHLPLLVYKQKTGTLHKVDTPGLPIGVERAGSYGQKRFTLADGDLIVLCTDGVLEAMNGEGKQYSVEGLKRVVTANADMEVGDLVETIRRDLAEFVGSARQFDDQTLLLMRV
jgi:sigma-B regulation protein RsbU (phosphoserine phosphatase)